METDNSVALERTQANSESLEELWTEYKAFRKATLEAEGALIEAGKQELNVLGRLDNRVDKLELKTTWLAFGVCIVAVIALLR